MSYNINPLIERYIIDCTDSAPVQPEQLAPVSIDGGQMYLEISDYVKKVDAKNIPRIRIVVAPTLDIHPVLSETSPILIGVSHVVSVGAQGVPLPTFAHSADSLDAMFRYSVYKNQGLMFGVYQDDAGILANTEWRFSLYELNLRKLVESVP